MVLRDQRLDRGFVAYVGGHARDRIGAVGAGDGVGQLGAIGNVGDHQPRAFGGSACE